MTQSNDEMWRKLPEGSDPELSRLQGRFREEALERATPDRWVTPVTLEGRLVRLEPLAEAHLAGLAEVAFDPAIWRWTTARPTDIEGLRSWLEAALRNREAGLEEPFATIDRVSGRPIGSTRFLSIVPEHRRLEIGWTWVAGPWQRRGANREAKYLQLRHAFEVLGANRVEFKTDSRNDKANPALLAIGATFEGTFRNHMVMPDGTLRHSNFYSVIVDEWPDIRDALERSLEPDLAAAAEPAGGSSGA